MPAAQARLVPLAILVLVASTSCNGQDAPPPPTATGTSTAAAPASTPEPAASPERSASGAVSAVPLPSHAGPLHPFCAAAFDQPMKSVLGEKCSAAEGRSGLGRIFHEDVRAVVERCQRVLADSDRIRLDEKVAASCAPKIAEKVTALALDKSKALVAYRGFEEIPACKGLVVGQRAEGASCADPSQCVAGLTCGGLKRETKQGICRKPGQKGQACDDHWSLELGANHPDCAAGLGCVDDVCTPLLPDGAACDRWPVCKSQHCSIQEGKMAGTCGPKRAVGAPCSDESDCIGSRCAQKKCAERLKAGGECVKDSDCLGVCDTNQRKCISFCGSG